MSNSKETDKSRRWLIIAVTAGLAVISLLLWSALENREKAGMAKLMATVAGSVHNELDTHLEMPVRELAYQARLWEARGMTQRAAWEKEAALFMRYAPDFQAIEWVDPSLHVRWVEPLKGNEAAVGIPSAPEERRSRALEAARSSREPVLSSIIDLIQGGKGFLVYVPLYRGDAFDGFIVGVFRIQQVFETAFAGWPERFAVSIYDESKLLYQWNQPLASDEAAWGQTVDFHLYDVTWRLRVAPLPDLARSQFSAMPEIVLISGWVASLLLGGVLFFFQQAQRRTRLLGQANRALEEDVVERRRAERALRDNEASLKLAQRIGKVGSWELDLRSQTIRWSDETYRIFGYQPNHGVPSREEFYATVHADDRRVLRTAIENALREGQSLILDYRITLADGSQRVVHELGEVVVDPGSGAVKLAGVVQDITDRKQAETEREKLIAELRQALSEVKTLSGLVPICAGCKKIRNDQGYWSQIETYITQHTGAKFSHGMCPECIEKYYPNLTRP